MKFALLPEGVVVSHPHLVKLIKIVPSNVQNRSSFVVVLRLYDSSEIMIKNCATIKEAEALVKTCTEAINLAVKDIDIEEYMTTATSLSQTHQQEYKTNFQTKTIESQKTLIPSSVTKQQQIPQQKTEDDSDEWIHDDGSDDWG